jgi:hypothetical protein
MATKYKCPRCSHVWSDVTPNRGGEIPETVSTTAVAKIFNLKPRTVRRWIESGRLPAMKRWINSRWRYSVRIEDVQKLMTEPTHEQEEVGFDGDVIDI